ncbi:MAG: hypothetical protein ACHQ4G_08600 [Opitutales bacterium]
MKLFTNLPGSLRFLFGTLRVLTVVFALFWFLTLAFGPWVGNRKSAEPRLMINFGEVVLRDGTVVTAAKSAGAKPAAITVGAVYGALFMDFAGGDAATTSALRWTLLPAMAVLLAFCWLLFGGLRTVCANIERGEVFSERNLRLVRGWA